MSKKTKDAPADTEAPDGTAVDDSAPDDTDETGRFGMVDIKAVKALPRPVTLDDIKKEPGLEKMILVNNSRLSVQPVTDEEWEIVCRMGGV